MKRILAALIPLVAAAAIAGTQQSQSICSQTVPSTSVCSVTVNVECSCATTTTAAAASPLSGFFTSFWKVADISDSIGSLTLTNSATPVTFSAGKIGNAGNFVGASPSFLNRAAVNFTGPSFTVAAWFKNTQVAANYIFNWNAATAPCVGLLINFPTNGKVSLFTDAGAAKHVDSAAATYNDGAYHLAVAYHDAATGQNVIIVDNGTPVTLAATADLSNSTQTLSIGRRTDGIGPFTGQIDAVGIADNKIPTAAQITAMWNGGTGAEPPF